MLWGDTMKQLMRVERVLHNCPEIDLDDEEEWPLISDEELHIIEEKCRGYRRDCVYVFYFFREKEDGTNYLELYFWCPQNKYQKYERFVICEGYRLSAKKELRFLEIIHERQLFNESFADYFGELQKRFPNIYFLCVNVSAYHRSVMYSNRAQEYEWLYYVSHRSGAKELLYKSGLIDIAWNLHRIPSVNLTGTTPEAILGLPMKLLRILDSPENVDCLFEEDTIELCRKTYFMFSDRIGKNNPSEAQWKYLCSLSDGDIGFNPRLYAFLSEADCKDDFVKFYEQCKQLYNDLKDIVNFDALKLKEDVRTMKMLKCLKMYKHYRADDIDDFESIRQKYEYYADDYIIIMPRNAVDFFNEAYSQGNCLMDYLGQVINGETHIVFLRKFEFPNKSFVTMEICDDEIIQVRCRFNRKPDDNILDFVERYAQIKGFVYNRYNEGCVYEYGNDFPEDLF